MRKHRSDRIIAILTLALIMVGLVVIYAIGPMRANFLNSVLGKQVYSEQSFFVHQLVTAVVAVVVMIIGFKLPYKLMQKYAKILMLGGLLACALLAMLAFGKSSLASCQLGGCRWFNLGPVNFQPAELVKLGLVFYIAQLIATRKKEGRFENSKDFWLPFGIVSAVALFFVIVLQKDLGTGAAMIAILLAMLWTSEISLKKFSIVLASIAVLGALAIISSPHRMQRLMTFSGKGNGYHINNAMMAIGSGGLFGVGVGNSVQATGYLPESINDSVFAVMGETFGFVGLMLVVAVFAILLIRLLKVANTLPDDEQRLAVIGIFAWIVSHVVINIAAMTGLMPLTGITLPLLSYGGTSMMFIALALGLCLQLSCYTGREVKNENISSGRRLGGAHHTGRRRSA